MIKVPYTHRAELHGYGLSGILKNLSRVARPLFQFSKEKVLKPIATQGLAALANTAKDVLKGDKPKRAFKKRVKSSAKKIKTEVKNNIKKALKGKGKKGGKKKKTSSKKKKVVRRKKGKKTGKKKTEKKQSIFANYSKLL